MFGLLIGIFLYFFFFKKETMKQYFKDKQQEIEDKLQKSKNSK